MKVTIIESLLETHKIPAEYLNHRALSVDRKSEPTTTPTESRSISRLLPKLATTSAKTSTVRTCNSLKKLKLLLKKHNKFHNFKETPLHTKINLIHYAVDIYMMILLLDPKGMDCSDYVLPSIFVKTGKFKCRCLEIQKNE